MKLFAVASLVLLGGALCLGADAAKTADSSSSNRSSSAAVSPASLELAANAAFEKQDYSTALPLYTKVAQSMGDQPEKLKAIQAKIQTCQQNMNKVVDPKTLLPAEATVEVKISPEERTPHIRPKDGEFLTCTIKELGNFEYDAEKGGNIPKDITQLSGCKFRTRGYMIPLDAADNIREFALVPSLFACCFGQPPQVQHTLVVHTPKGKTVSYFPDEIVVEGTLKVREKKEDGLVVSVFEIDCTSVKTAAK